MIEWTYIPEDENHEMHKLGLSLTILKMSDTSKSQVDIPLNSKLNGKLDPMELLDLA